MRKLTTEEFISKAKAIHGEKYNYSKVDYKGSTYKVIIICKNHGEFEQNSHDHLCGKGCKECGKLIVGNRKSQEDFIAGCKTVHNNFYNYENVIYIQSKLKIDIVCPIHGQFSQIAEDHLLGKGCPTCGVLKNTLHRTKSLDCFIEQANIIHKNKYNYFKVNYINSKENIIITCPIHGDFEQTPHKHLLGQHCPKCKMKNQNLLYEKLKLSLKEEILYEYSPK
jgi:hypothetical protein